MLSVLLSVSHWGAGSWHPNETERLLPVWRSILNAIKETGTWNMHSQRAPLWCGGGGRSAYETQERGDAKIEAENEVKREEKHACWRLCLYGNDIHLPPYFMHQILRTICRILANITVHLWEPFISLIHWSTGDKRRTERLQRQKSQTAKPLRCEQVPISKINIISVWASRNLCAFVLTL